MVKKVKISVCKKCKGWVTASVSDATHPDKGFYQEVVKHNLDVKELTLTKWQKTEMQHCNCSLSKNKNYPRQASGKFIPGGFEVLSQKANDYNFDD